MLNRKIAPEFEPIKNFKLVQAQKSKLKNQVELFVFDSKNQEVVSLELIFRAGKSAEKQLNTADFCAKMWLEGTKNSTAKQISERIDYYGAAIYAQASNEIFSVELLCLKKYFEPVLQLFVELLSEQIFPKEELQIIKERSLQNLQVQLEKNTFLAARKFREALLPQEHIYARNTTENSIEAIESSLLEEFFNSKIKNAPFTIFASGRIDSEQITLMEKYLGTIPTQKTFQKLTSQDLKYNSEITKSYTQRKDAVQTSLILGRGVFNTKDSDYTAFVLANTILGGYFGSRLIQNIREEKGYTYSIYSSIAFSERANYWLISTDVKKEHRLDTIKEIYKEIELMQTQIVPEEELQRVKNYISGNFVNALNTPFATAQKHQKLYLNELKNTFFDEFLVELRTISAEEVLAVSQKYFSKDLIEIQVG